MRTLQLLLAAAEVPQVVLAGPSWCLRFFGTGCRDIRSKELCTSSRDGGPWRTMGREQVYGEPCMWCGGEKCTEADVLCTPVNSIEAAHLPEGSEEASCRESDELWRDWHSMAENSLHDKTLYHVERNLTFLKRIGENPYAGQACRAKNEGDMHEKDPTTKNYYAVWYAATLSECFDFCRWTPDCTGVEYKAADKYCEVWNVPITTTQDVDGIECYAVGDANSNLLVTGGLGWTNGTALQTSGNAAWMASGAALDVSSQDEEAAASGLEAREGGAESGLGVAGGTEKAADSGPSIGSILMAVLATMLLLALLGACVYFGCGYDQRKKDKKKSKTRAASMIKEKEGDAEKGEEEEKLPLVGSAPGSGMVNQSLYDSRAVINTGSLSLQATPVVSMQPLQPVQAVQGWQTWWQQPMYAIQNNSWFGQMAQSWGQQTARGYEQLEQAEPASSLVAEPVASMQLMQQGSMCPQCGNVYAPDAIFCRKCGRKRDQATLGTYPLSG
eukprot:TRINITY_DN47213_c0_g1_i1.p1 TRINITY_DN47213_c0_g1~~TRINITY_DN47213_c0_g1_i1.p1  ORF type:complete len:514 (+),score=106.51 TRINITY_DN47213_c0_g1_i1:43-1542(+)